MKATKIKWKSSIFLIPALVLVVLVPLVLGLLLSRSFSDPTPQLCRPLAFGVQGYSYIAAFHSSKNASQPVSMATLSFLTDGHTSEGPTKPALCNATDTTHIPPQFAQDQVYQLFSFSDKSTSTKFGIAFAYMNFNGSSFTMQLNWTCNGVYYASWTPITINPYTCQDYDDGTTVGTSCKGPDEEQFFPVAKIEPLSY